MNVAIERMVTFHGYRFALRGGVDNATGQANPPAVDNVSGAAARDNQADKEYLSFPYISLTPSRSFFPYTGPYAAIERHIRQA